MTGKTAAGEIGVAMGASLMRRRRPQAPREDLPAMRWVGCGWVQWSGRKAWPSEGPPRKATHRCRACRRSRHRPHPAPASPPPQPPLPPLPSLHFLYDVAVASWFSSAARSYWSSGQRRGGRRRRKVAAEGGGGRRWRRRRKEAAEGGGGGGDCGAGGGDGGAGCGDGGRRRRGKAVAAATAAARAAGEGGRRKEVAAAAESSGRRRWRWRGRRWCEGKWGKWKCAVIVVGFWIWRHASRLPCACPWPLPLLFSLSDITRQFLNGSSAQ